MTEVSIGKYCQFVIIFTKYWGNIITYIPPRISGDSPHVPLNFPVMPAGLRVEVIAKVPSRYYQVPRYFFTVLTVAHNQWYCPTLRRIAVYSAQPKAEINSQSAHTGKINRIKSRQNTCLNFTSGLMMGFGKDDIIDLMKYIEIK